MGCRVSPESQGSFLKKRTSKLTSNLQEEYELGGKGGNCFRQKEKYEQTAEDGSTWQAHFGNLEWFPLVRV